MMIPKQLTPTSPTVLLTNLKTRSLPYKIAVMTPANRTNVLKTVRNVFRDFNFLYPFVKLLDNSDLSIILSDDLVNNLVKQSREGLLDLVNNQLPELCKQELEITDFSSYVKVLMAISYPVYLERCKTSDVSTDKTVDQVMTMIESGKLTKD